ncbi:hypothetical protein QKT73_gp2 [Trialeurodes vaporariorum mononega-like virus 2]|uniref:Glycoprotein n=3 Tax=Chuviridae TaxID=2501952 RepID=A0A916LL75_9VIRU|nr:hypothetical protein QKT73_gp2 [Trialeurodes vaporariorum mononega-like virus 2]QLL27735.1 hypothetical protein [Leveillula taurica associated chu-like virus 1]DAZ90598.1 TPA_asm: hypothetical protein [Trialeurodes vaporariorum mononega-like virus 2]
MSGTSAIAAVALTMVYLVSGTSITGYDCTTKDTNVTTLSLDLVAGCNALPVQGQNVTSLFIQLVSPKTHNMLEIRSCKVTVSYLIMYCGTFDVSSMLSNNFATDEPVELTTDRCLTIHQTGTFKSISGHQITGLKRGISNNVKVTEFGVLDGNDCEGSSFTLNGLTYNNAVMNTHYKITYDQRQESLDNKLKLVSTYDGVMCNYNDFSCFVGGTMYLWSTLIIDHSCGDEMYNLVYEGYANLTKSDQNPDVLTVETRERNFAIALSTQQLICGRDGYLTETSDFKVIVTDPYNRPKHVTKSDVTDINAFSDTNMKFIYVESHIKERTTSLYNLFTRRYCELNRNRIMSLLSLARTNPEEFAIVYTNEPGYTAITRGEVVHLLKCEPVVVFPRDVDECYNDLPVSYMNDSYFLKPTSRIMVKYGQPVPCNPFTSTMYKISSTWMRIGVESHEGTPPLELKPTFDDTWSYGKSKSLSKLGYISREDETRYLQSIIRPLESKAIESTFIRRVQNHGQSSVQGLDFNSAMQVDKLVSSLTDKVLHNIYGIWDFAIKHLGAIFGFKIMYDFILGFFGFLINVFVLYHEYGMSYLLLFAMWSAMTKHLVYGKLHDKWAKYKQSRQNSSENGSDEPEPGTSGSDPIDIELGLMMRNGNESDEEQIKPVIVGTKHENQYAKLKTSGMRIYPNLSKAPMITDPTLSKYYK